MKIVFLNYFSNGDSHDSSLILEYFWTLTELAESLAKLGEKVVILQRFYKDMFLKKNKVSYYFVADNYNKKLRFLQIPSRVHQVILLLQPDIVHIHGLLFPIQIRALKRKLHRNCKIVAQHHAEEPWGSLKRFIQYWGLRAVDGFLFTTIAQAKIWQKRGLIASSQQVFPLMEGSTQFRLLDGKLARDKTGIKGDPIFLWVGRLNKNKDPLTVLQGFMRVLNQVPSAKLFMIFQSCELISEVRQMIANDASLKEAVTLLGKCHHKELEDYYNSADYFVLGSHSESTGYALVEALACGAVPIVTDIPSFRMMTNNGKIGKLWKVGNPDSFAEAVLNCLQNQALEHQKEMARAFFETNLDYSVIAHRLIRIYRHLLRVK